uniref:Centrosomal protein 57kDa-like protein 1 n=1 Tax=Mola mola TaxID=94237 RepID=A0A3Q3WWQ4_MOLML
MDSPSKNSYIGSYYQPPDRILAMPRQLEFPARTSTSVDPQMGSPQLSLAQNNLDSRAVVDALKTLQQKIRQLELERKRAEKSYRAEQFSHSAQNHHQQATASHMVAGQLAAKQESKLQGVEARCKVLEKQLDYMRKMVENAKKERNALVENQVVQNAINLKKQNAKLAILEEKLLKEEHERQLVQEKAEQVSSVICLWLRIDFYLPSFVQSTSPSHSVHANVQSILHMMKHHQPQLCERVTALHRSGSGIKKNLQKDFTLSLGSLSDLLLALQDELGQMSFEHQELVSQIDGAQHREQREDLQRELERLVAKMEEKGVQITKLRKHQKTIHDLTRSQPCTEEPTTKKLNGFKPAAHSPLKAKQKGKKGGTTMSNLQLLRETQKFRNSLTQADVFWET